MRIQGPPAVGLVTQPKTSADLKEISNIIQVKLDALVQKGYPAVQLCIKSPKGKVTASSGLKNLHDSRKVADETKFAIGSVTKIFVATMILELVQQGYLSLEDTIKDHLPELAEQIQNPDKITIAHLLQHSSGLPDYIGSPKFRETLLQLDDRQLKMADTVDTIVGLEHESEPGAQFNYTNTGYNLLGLILEKIYNNQPLEKILEDRITNKLQMSNTDFTYPINDDRFATAYTNIDQHFTTEELAQSRLKSQLGPENNGLQECSKLDSKIAAYAAGGIVSTVDDLSTFCEALFNSNKLLTQKIRDSLSSNTISQGAKHHPSRKYGYGLVVEQTPDLGLKLGHAGSSLGQQCEFSYYPDHKLSIIGLTNRDWRENTTSLGDDLSKELLSDTIIRNFFMSL